MPTNNGAVNAGHLAGPVGGGYFHHPALNHYCAG